MANPQILDEIGSKVSELLANSPAKDLEPNAMPCFASGFFQARSGDPRRVRKCSAKCWLHTREKLADLEHRVARLGRAGPARAGRRITPPHHPRGAAAPLFMSAQEIPVPRPFLSLLTSAWACPAAAASARRKPRPRPPAVQRGDQTDHRRAAPAQHRAPSYTDTPAAWPVSASPPSSSAARRRAAAFFTAAGATSTAASPPCCPRPRSWAPTAPPSASRPSDDQEFTRKLFHPAAARRRDPPGQDHLADLQGLPPLPREPQLGPTPDRQR